MLYSVKFSAVRFSFTSSLFLSLHRAVSTFILFCYPVQMKSSNPPKVEWNIELIKLLYDYLKHITTLCTGSILVVITFSEKLANASYKICLKTSLVLFIISIIFAVTSLPSIAVLSDSALTVGTKDGLWGESKFSTITAVLTVITFVFGLISLIVFGFANV